VQGLIARGASVRAFDPVATEQAEKVFEHVEFATDALAAAEDADALVIVTEWDEFRALDLEKVAQAMRGKILVDLRNVYDRDEAAEAGLVYFGVGRGKPAA
jgi:UDPglucose 6-dehydrogenase